MPTLQKHEQGYLNSALQHAAQAQESNELNGSFLEYKKKAK